MVQVAASSTKRSQARPLRSSSLSWSIVILILFLAVLLYRQRRPAEKPLTVPQTSPLWPSSESQPQQASHLDPRESHPESSPRLENTVTSHAYTCPYMKLSELSDSERYPKATSSRHMVDPPIDTRIDLLCCETTKGPWNIAVHHSWAPLGAQRVMEMVNSNYFGRNRVPLMRCVEDFLCQFGLAGPDSELFDSTIPDDPQWLPEGPKHRRNERGVRRFQRGYFSYAGSGPHSRSQQLFVALVDSGPLGGGSPWEVPWGELVGQHSYETLDKIYTGYDEDGPSQESLYEPGSLEATAIEFPELDWVISCRAVDQIDPA